MLLYALSDCSLCSIPRTAAFTRFGGSIKDQLTEFYAQVVHERLGDKQWINMIRLTNLVFVTQMQR